MIFNLETFGQTQNVSVSVNVPPKQSDFQFAFDSTEGSGPFTHDQVLNYKITYGAQASAHFATTTVIEADYSADTAPGGSHVLDYVPGSASNGYGGAVPVVDLTNRKITWTISAFPAGTTNQTVTFQLRTNSNYTGPTPVNFTIKAKMSNEYVTMLQQTVTQTYQYDASLTPTPTPTATPTPTPGTSGGSSESTQTQTASLPSVFPTLAPRVPRPAILKILTIAFTNVTAHEATIAITTSTPAKHTIFYGTAPSALLQKVTSLNFATVSSLTLSNLTPNTTYYFRIFSIDKDSNQITSEIYTFHTAKEGGGVIVPEKGAVAVVSEGSTIYSAIFDAKSKPGFILLPEHTAFTLNYTTEKSIADKSFDVIMRSKNNPGEVVTVHLLKKSPFLYSAQLQTLQKGWYEIFLKAADTSGNITEWNVLSLKVVAPLLVLDKNTHKPIEGARAFFSYFNPDTNSYQPLTRELSGSLKNPGYTDAKGTVRMLLLPGKYHVEVSNYFYDTVSQEFTLGARRGEEFPIVYLAKSPFTLLNILAGVAHWLIDTFLSVAYALRLIGGSARAFSIIAGSIITTSLGMGLLFFHYRTHIRPKDLPAFFLFGLHKVLNKHKEQYIFGTIMDADSKPITRARIELIEKQSREILMHTTSNMVGRFHFHRIDSDKALLLQIEKDGYKEVEQTLSAEHREIAVTLEHAKGRSGVSDMEGVRIIEHIGSSLFETILLLSIIGELIFLVNFGFFKTLPFFALSLLNVLLWAFFEMEKSR